MTQESPGKSPALDGGQAKRLDADPLATAAHDRTFRSPRIRPGAAGRVSALGHADRSTPSARRRLEVRGSRYERRRHPYRRRECHRCSSPAPGSVSSLRARRLQMKCIGYGSWARSDGSAVRGLARRLGGRDFGTPTSVSVVLGVCPIAIGQGIGVARGSEPGPCCSTSRTSRGDSLATDCRAACLFPQLHSHVFSISRISDSFRTIPGLPPGGDRATFGPPF